VQLHRFESHRKPKGAFAPAGPQHGMDMPPLPPLDDALTPGDRPHPNIISSDQSTNQPNIIRTNQVMPPSIQTHKTII
jgi:hypothetical protein